MKYVEGDMFKMAEQGLFDFVVQGCNCYNAMGSGVAKTVRDFYKPAYNADLATKEGDLSKLGKFTVATIKGPFHDSEEFRIINAYTQAGFWDTGKPNVDYEAVYDCFKSIKLIYDTYPSGLYRFAIPKIGAVRGGGVWSDIEAIIDSVGIVDLTCVVYNGNLNK